MCVGWVGCTSEAQTFCEGTASRLAARDQRCDLFGPGLAAYEEALGGRDCATAPAPRDSSLLANVCWPALEGDCSATPTLPEACRDQY